MNRRASTNSRTSPEGRCRRGRLAGDRGSATAWGLLIIIVGLLLTGAVLDGGNAMAAKARTLGIAQQAARAGANQLDLAALRNQGLLQLDPTAAQTAAAIFLEQAGATGTVTATVTQVTVTVTARQPTQLLSAIGIATIPVTATATAAPIPSP